MSRAVEVDDPDTIEYKFYLNNDGTNALDMEYLQIQRPYLLIITALHLI
jgi:hypothetical protein